MGQPPVNAQEYDAMQPNLLATGAVWMILQIAQGVTPTLQTIEPVIGPAGYWSNQIDIGLAIAADRMFRLTIEEVKP